MQQQPQEASVCPFATERCPAPATAVAAASGAAATAAAQAAAMAAVAEAQAAAVALAGCQASGACNLNVTTSSIPSLVIPGLKDPFPVSQGDSDSPGGARADEAMPPAAYALAGGIRQPPEPRHRPQQPVTGAYLVAAMQGGTGEAAPRQYGAEFGGGELEPRFGDELGLRIDVAACEDHPVRQGASVPAYLRGGGQFGRARGAYVAPYDDRSQVAWTEEDAVRQLGFESEEPHAFAPQHRRREQRRARHARERGVIPTPVRSRWHEGASASTGSSGASAMSQDAVGKLVADFAVQVDRRSIDRHTQREGPDTDHACMERETPGWAAEAECRTGLAELAYPQLVLSPAEAAMPSTALAEVESAAPDTWRGRAALVRGLAESIADELEEVALAWGVGSELAVDESVAQSTELAVLTWLRKVTRGAERRCVMKTLQPPKNSQDADVAAGTGEEEEADLQLRCVRLEAEIAAEDVRFERLRGLGEEIDPPEGQRGFLAASDACRDLQAMASQLAAEICSRDGGDAAMTRGAIEAANNLQQSSQRLALMEMYMQRTLGQLDGAKEQLLERERRAAAQGFAHLPGDAPAGLRALGAVP